MTRPAMVGPSSPAEFLPELALFAITVGLAWQFDWKTSDLLWSMWLAGVVIGYAALLLGLAGQWRRWTGDATRRRFVLLGAGLFYTVHFLGFNWIVASVLPWVAPLEGLRGGVASARFWSVLFSQYWPMLLITVISERQMLRRVGRHFEQLSPYLPVLRTWVIFLPLFFAVLVGDVTKLYTVDHIICYALVAIAYFSPWRLGREQELAHHVR